MEFRRIVIAAAVLTLFAVGAFATFQIASSAQADAPDERLQVTNETVNQEFDAYQFVDAAQEDYTTDFNNSSVEAYNSSNVELQRGTDYRWNNSDGTIRFLDTASTNESETATVSYRHGRNTQAVRDVAGPLSSVVASMGPLALLAGGTALVVVLLAIAVFIGSRLGGSSLPDTNR